MSITLYTPATGFPDLEIKIAYGLARVGIEAFGINNVRIIPLQGFYEIQFNGDFDKLNDAFNKIAQRILSSSYIAQITPGITGGSADGFKTEENESYNLSIYKTINPLAQNKQSETFCRHSSRSKISNVLGLTAMATTGVLCKRDGIDITFYKGQPRRPTDPRNICKTCGLLALLGIWYGSFIFNISEKEALVIPIPKDELSGGKLQEIFALQHQIRKEWFSQKFPQVLIPIIFLSKIPSLADILDGFDLFVAVLSRQQGYHVDGIQIISIDKYIDFIKASPFNIATIEMMFKNEAYASLMELNNLIYYNKKDSLLKFPRLYVQETSPKNGSYVNLLYPKTAKYLLKEVAMIKQDIIENPYIKSLARTLRYFIRERKYGYADDIRNARKDSRDFEETIAKMLREAEIRRVQQEQDKKEGKEIKNWIYIPKENEIQEVFKLANENFEATKTALVILAFSFEYGTKEEGIETTEGGDK